MHREPSSPDLPTPEAVFDRLASAYEQHAALEREVCARLAERSSFNRVEPRCILDLGCRTGYGAAWLKNAFRRAQVVGVEVAPAMLGQLGRKSRFRRPLRAVCGRLTALPFADRCADLVFCNLGLHWLPRPGDLFKEVRRVLRPQGMFLFSALGPGSLAELRQTWPSELEGPVLPQFPDLLELGDAAVAAGFLEPVMDMEVLTLQYPSVEALARELEANGTSLLVGGWEAWKQRLGEVGDGWRSLASGDRFPLAFEVVYGTAFGPSEGQPRRTARGDEVRISVDSLLKSRTMG